MRILKELCALPTVPFEEGRVVEWVEGFVRGRRRLRVERDEWGNVLVELKGKKKGGARWVFGAHIDHPGMVAKGMVDRRIVEAEFRGWVLAELVKGAKVRFFEESGREVAGKVIEATAGEDGGRTASVRVRVGEAVAAGAIGMWDVENAVVKGGKFYARGCDDVAGAAAALSMMDELQRDPPAATVAVLLTRAEEEGFIGAIGAAKRPRLLRKTDRIVSIETSAMQAYAPQGSGPIIRVGDKTSVFDSGLTCFLTQQAEALKKTSKGFAYQRALMPGGTCEATVYDAYGFTAAAICVALGNYHNMDRERKRIVAEYVDVGDWKSMVKLFVAIARNGHEYREGHGALRERIEARFAKLKRLL